MKDPITVSSYVLIKGSTISRNGQVLYRQPAAAGPDFLDQAYEALGIQYPRFHKMDHLCKTGFLAAEILLQNNDWKQNLQPEQIGIFLSNAHSSLDTDIRYEQSLATNPSPSLFVYTLPNVLIGELCIRHGIKGETACFVFDIFDPRFQADYVNGLFETGKIKKGISGWADYYQGQPTAFFYLAEPAESSNSLKHDSITLNKIFQRHE